MSQFRFEEFNPRRHMRGAEAARVTWVNDQGEEDTLWMSHADIRSNVLLHGPHYGLLVAASHYHMKADQLVALHRSKGKNKAFLQPLYPVPHDSGVWAHPDYPLAEKENHDRLPIGVWLDINGVEVVHRFYEGCLGWRDGSAVQLYGDDVAAYTSMLTPPDGDGWQIVRVVDTKAGPTCTWLRKLEVA